MEPPLAVSTAGEPLHITASLFWSPEVSVTVMPGTGSGLTVMLVDVAVVQPFALVTVTV